MTNKILIVTPPDDSLLQGIRITHVHLNEEQSNIISNALLQTSLPNTIINYVWKMGDRVDWLLDKIAKSDIVFFNADTRNNGAVELIIGWTAAQPQSYYFGSLRDLHLANDNVVYDSADILNLLEKISTKNTFENNTISIENN
jgi:hypothetical protein